MQTEFDGHCRPFRFPFGFRRCQTSNIYMSNYVALYQGLYAFGTKCLRVNPRPAGVFGRTRHTGRGSLCINEYLLFKEILKGLWRSQGKEKVTSQFKIRSKSKIITFRTISYMRGSGNSCKPKLCQYAFQGMWRHHIECCRYTKSRSRSGHMRTRKENVAQMSCDTCLIGQLGSRIRRWHSISNLSWSKVNVRVNQVKLGLILKIKV